MEEGQNRVQKQIFLHPASEPALEHAVVGERRKPKRSGVACSDFRQEAHELTRAHLYPTLGSSLAHTSDDVPEGRRLDIDHVDRDLDARARRKEEAEGLHAGHASARPPYRGGDRVCVGEVSGREVNVEGNEERACADQDTACAGVKTCGPERGSNLAHVHAALQLRRASATEEGRSSPASTDAVEEDRQPELVSHAPPEHERHVLGHLHFAAANRHHRNDIRGPDARVNAVMGSKVYEFRCSRNAGKQGLHQIPFPGDDRENGAVVVGVGVDVEHPPVPSKCLRDGLDDREISPLGDIRYGFEQSHGRTLRCSDMRSNTTETSPEPPASYSSIASLHRGLAACRRCADAGFPIESLPVVQGAAGRRAYLYGQAPGIVEGVAGAPWQGRAGQTLRRWLELDEHTFDATFYCASVTRCYPGRDSGRGDRTPSPAERRLCTSWRSEELRLLRPTLILTVGGLAAKAIVGATTLTACVGKSYLVNEAVVIPLPHPSGASAWLNEATNRRRLGKALTHARREIGRLHDAR